MIVNKMAKASLNSNSITLNNNSFKKGSYRSKIFTKHPINYSIITIMKV